MCGRERGTGNGELETGNWELETIPLPLVGEVARSAGEGAWNREEDLAIAFWPPTHNGQLNTGNNKQRREHTSPLVGEVARSAGEGAWNREEDLAIAFWPPTENGQPRTDYGAHQ
jgi:hypothetical protein